MKNELCEHKFRLNSARLGTHCPHCYPYKVGEEEFTTFDEVIAYAWNTYKIDVHPDLEPHMYTQACSELEELIEKLEEESDNEEVQSHD